MNRPVIGFDVDGTLLDLHSAWVSEYNNLSGDDISVDDILEWRVPDYMPMLPFDDVVDIIHNPSIYFRVQSFYNVNNILEAIRGIGWDFVFVSHCYPIRGMVKAKIDCLRYNGLMWADEVNKFISVSSDYKHLIDVNILVDDRPKTVEAHKHGFLVRQPWNKGIRTKNVIESWSNTSWIIAQFATYLQAQGF